MYNYLKKQLKRLIPESTLVKNEAVLRKMYSFFYSGSSHQCNICNKKLRTFIQLKNTDLLCPSCGSLARNRRLFQYITKAQQLKGTVLHFSPSRSLYRLLKHMSTIQYFSTDFENEFLADYKYDITHISQKDNTFNTILCYHILEHIEADIKAMKELYRVLKPMGKIYIQTPFKTGEIYEDASIVSPIEREKHFGQKDHVRIYSVEGLKTRLTSVGFHVEIKTFHKQKEDLYLGLQSPETILIASK